MRLLSAFFLLAIIAFSWIGLSMDKSTSQSTILIYLISVCAFALFINYKINK